MVPADIIIFFLPSRFIWNIQAPSTCTGFAFRFLVSHFPFPISGFLLLVPPTLATGLVAHVSTLTGTLAERSGSETLYFADCM